MKVLNLLTRLAPLMVVAMAASVHWVQAQTWPSYSVKLLPAVKSSSGATQRTHAVGLGSGGDVTGWTVKSAGTMSIPKVYESGVGLFPSFSLITGFKLVPAYETYPVVWTSSGTKVLARPEGSYNAMGMAISDDGSVLMAVANKSGKTRSNEGFFPDVHGHLRLWQGSRYVIPTLDSARILSPSVEGLGLRVVYGLPGGRFVVNSQEGGIAPVILQGTSTTPILPTPPDGIWSSKSLEDLWPDGRGWIYTYTNSYDAPNSRSKCYVGVPGQMTEWAKPEGSIEFDCLAMNASGSVFGVDHVAPPGLTPSGQLLMHDNYYLVKDGRKQGVNVSGVVSNSFLDTQGRLIYAQSPVYGQFWDGLPNSMIRVWINGVSRPVTELVKTSLGSFKGIALVDRNERGQLLIQILRTNSMDYAVLTP